MSTILTKEQIEEDEREATFENCGFDPNTIDGRGEIKEDTESVPTDEEEGEEDANN